MKDLLKLLLVLQILILQSCSSLQKNNYPPELEIILNEFDKCSKNNALYNYHEILITNSGDSLEFSINAPINKLDVWVQKGEMTILNTQPDGIIKRGNHYFMIYDLVLYEPTYFSDYSYNKEKLIKEMDDLGYVNYFYEDDLWTIETDEHGNVTNDPHTSTILTPDYSILYRFDPISPTNFYRSSSFCDVIDKKGNGSD
ncbi:hypothetical protein CW736_06125 [Nonlabens sp. MB-3u-79]|uniref:hypothetical protein n=1 Tax=Nonlabens sp. MB-3u-79 TaxID=2058134 RepID=UPI000C30CE43|nr:hypothetical protein [Nonlabens sp. MB-3u-79]AUC79000.1 hypothetical protein CW736_06125 [Nonlabens sp. MB-3u-79]